MARGLRGQPIDRADGVIDFDAAMTRRLRRKAVPLGVEVRSTGSCFALYGPDRGLFLHPSGMRHDIRWLSYDEASEVLERHIAAPSGAGRRRSRSDDTG